MEGELWFQYEGVVNSRPKLNRESSVVYRANAQEYEIRILEYDKAHGNIRFGCREELPAAHGCIVFSFRWLLRRLLEWIEQRGATICPLEDLPGLQPPPGCHFPEGISQEQSEAVRAMLSNPLSYVWGPPGTGKSTWVLATAVSCCVDADETVLVLAPTNLAVDNALAAILQRVHARDKVLRLGTPGKEFLKDHHDCCESVIFRRQVDEARQEIQEAEEEITRLENVCELTQQEQETTARMEHLHQELEARRGQEQEHRRVIQELETKLTRTRHERDEHRAEYERQSARQAGLGFPALQQQLDAVEADHVKLIQTLHELDQMEKGLRWYERLTSKPARIAETRTKGEARRGQVEATLSSLRQKHALIAREYKAAESQVLALDAKVRALTCGINSLETELCGKQGELTLLLESVLHMRADLEELDEQRYELLAELHDKPDASQCEWRMDALRAKISERQKIIEKYHQDRSSKRVLGLTLDAFIGMTMGGNTLSADRIFVDEAAYAPLAKVIPLLSLRCPISLLGDHLQLPPVCEVKNSPISRSYWAKRSILLEDAFEVGDQYSTLNGKVEPLYQLMPRLALTRSYRFGPRLASLLDRAVYGRMGLVGLAGSDTTIKTYDCRPREREGRIKRQNDQEAARIVQVIREWLAHRACAGDTLAVLSAYKNQTQLIRDRVRKEFRDEDRIEVLNVHQAQGREWDCVLFSVADTGNLRQNWPWFTDDGKPQTEALALLNTAFSRARKHLRFFLDAGFWEGRMPGRLLNKIVRELPPEPFHEA